MTGLGRDSTAIKQKMQICHVIEKGADPKTDPFRQSPTTGNVNPSEQAQAHSPC